MAKFTKEQQKENRKLWADALRSGEYEQTKFRLQRPGNKFCCLGVLQKISGSEVISPSTVYPSQYAMNFVGLASMAGEFESDLNQDSLSSLNDTGWTFDQIADLIESEPEGMFL